MSYNTEVYRKVREEFETRHFEAERRADEKRAELQRAIPGLDAIDRRLAMTGPRLMAIALGKSTETVEEVKKDITSLRSERDALITANGYPADYSDVVYSCPLCSDSGFSDGRMCSCMKREILMRTYAASGVGRLMEECRFDNFDLSFYSSDQRTYSNMKRVFEFIRDYAEDFSLSSDSLALFGNTGLGKTHLSVALTKKVIDKGFDALYTGSVGMFSDFEGARFRTDTGTGNGNDTSRYFTCELLVIDDLGAEVPSAFTVSCLYDLINRRSGLGLPTVISTNLNQRELGERYTDRIVSRIFGDYRTLYFTGTDVRRQKLG